MNKDEKEKIVIKILKELKTDKNNWKVNAKDIPNAIYNIIGKNCDDDLYDDIYENITTLLAIYSK